MISNLISEPYCDKCQGTGWVIRMDDNKTPLASPCGCQAVQRSQSVLRRSGLAAVANTKTFDTFDARSPWQKRMLDTARRYVDSPGEAWLVVLGQPGSGKTHICTATALELMHRNNWGLRYMTWRSDANRLKSIINDSDAYAQAIYPLKSCKVLYIDDLFKIQKDREVSQGDINLAFDIINHRYNNPSMLTIISSEHSAKELLEIDEAIGSRIFERAGGKPIVIAKDLSRNFRLNI